MQQQTGMRILAGSVMMFLLPINAADADINWNDTGSQTPSAPSRIVVDGSGEVDSVKSYQDKTTAPLDQSDTLRLQQALAAEGYYKGAMDGLWSEDTTKAVLDYQHINQMTMTGKLDEDELQRLGIH